MTKQQRMNRTWIGKRVAWDAGGGQMFACDCVAVANMFGNWRCLLVPLAGNRVQAWRDAKKCVVRPPTWQGDTDDAGDEAGQGEAD
jgi:hypothetical protein